jgi:hypothetical protein
MIEIKGNPGFPENRVSRQLEPFYANTYDRELFGSDREPMMIYFLGLDHL